VAISLADFFNFPWLFCMPITSFAELGELGWGFCVEWVTVMWWWLQKRDCRAEIWVTEVLEVGGDGKDS